MQDFGKILAQVAAAFRYSIWACACFFSCTGVILWARVNLGILVRLIPRDKLGLIAALIQKLMKEQALSHK